MKRCKNCQSTRINDEGGDYCFECDSQRKTVVIIQDNEFGVIFNCKICGNDVQEGDNYCSLCGVHLYF